MSNNEDLSDAFFDTDPAGPKDTSIPIFFWQAKRQPKAEKEAGHAVFALVPWVQIILPEDKNSVPIREAKDADKVRWPRQWEAFQLKGRNRPDGTPIEQFPMLDFAQVATLKHYKILTVEELAGLDADRLGTLGQDGEKMQKSAQAWLSAQSEDVANAMAQIDDLKAQNETLRAEIEALNENANDRETVPATPPTDAPRRRGRPPKQKALADDPVDHGGERSA